MWFLKWVWFGLVSKKITTLSKILDPPLLGQQQLLGQYLGSHMSTQLLGRLASSRKYRCSPNGISSSGCSEIVIAVQLQGR